MFPTVSLLGKRLQLGCYVNVRTLRDHAKREAFAAAEQTRQALKSVSPHRPSLLPRHADGGRWCAHRYISRNTLLPPRQRTKAMIELAQMDTNTRPMKIKNRCIMGGKGRGVMRDFRVSRVSSFLLEWGGEEGREG